MTISETTTARAQPGADDAGHPAPEGAAPSPPPGQEPFAGQGGAGAQDTAPLHPVEVRRNAVVAGVIGAGAAAMATAYLWRAVDTGGMLDWLLCGLLAVLAVGNLRSLLDARTPLLVADELGVRIRLGSDWRGVPWDAVDRVVVTPRRGLLRDGRLVVNLLDPVEATSGLHGRALRHAQLNRRLYGAALAAPLGLTTRVSGGGEVRARVSALSRGRTEVVTLLDTPGPVLRPVEEAPASPAAAADPRAEEPETRAGRRSGRRDRRTVPFRVVDATDAVTSRTEPVSGDLVDDFEPQPARNPVIGPELAAARGRVGLSVDQLADRTRIRPHVIESIEVDDFTPCGGDFYARGHIRTLARVLGKDPVPMLEAFEQRYATAPVSARKVFEAELATGMTGTVRGGGLGGPNWPLLVGAVLVLVLVWSGVRLFAGSGEEVLETPPPVLSGSAELASGFGTPPAAEQETAALTVSATNAGAGVEVRDGRGELLFEGDLALGESRQVEGVPPLTVSADDGGAVTVALDGRQRGPVGQEGETATRVFQAPPD